MVRAAAAPLQVDPGEHQHVKSQQEAARAHRHAQRHRVAAGTRHSSASEHTARAVTRLANLSILLTLYNYNV